MQEEAPPATQGDFLELLSSQRHHDYGPVPSLVYWVVTLCSLLRSLRNQPDSTVKDRMPGPPFNELDEEKLGLRRTMRGMRKSGMSGTLFDRESMMGKVVGTL